MKVLLINQSYVPDRGASGLLLNDLVGAFHDRGCYVTVVAAPPTYSVRRTQWTPLEQGDGLCIYRVGSDRFRGRKSMLTRLAGYFNFMWSAWLKTRSLISTERFDIVTTASNPPLVGVIGVWAAHQLGVPFVYMLHDLHPDSFVASGHKLLSVIRWIWDRLNEHVFRNASRIIVVGCGMKRSLEKKGVLSSKIEVIPQWAHPELTAPPRDRDSGCQADENCPTTILYFGNLGLGQSLDWLVNAASKVRNVNVKFWFMGEGPEKDHLVALARQLDLDNVEFFPYRVGKEFEATVRMADACVVALKPGLETLAVPSKTYVILSAGKPILALLSRESDVADVIDRHKCGWVVESASEVADVVRSISQNREDAIRRGLNARMAHETEFAFELASTRYWRVFSECAGAPAQNTWAAQDKSWRI